MSLLLPRPWIANITTVGTPEFSGFLCHCWNSPQSAWKRWRNKIHEAAKAIQAMTSDMRSFPFSVCFYVLWLTFWCLLGMYVSVKSVFTFHDVLINPVPKHFQGCLPIRKSMSFVSMLLDKLSNCQKQPWNIPAKDGLQQLRIPSRNPRSETSRQLKVKIQGTYMLLTNDHIASQLTRVRRTPYLIVEGICVGESWSTCLHKSDTSKSSRDDSFCIMEVLQLPVLKRSPPHLRILSDDAFSKEAYLCNWLFDTCWVCWNR